MSDVAPPAPAPEAKADTARSIFDVFETDTDVETKGVLLRYSPTIRILVARAGGSNKKYERLVAQLTKPHRHLIRAVQGGTATDEDAKLLDSILQEAYAKTVILGWEGIQLERGGAYVEYTPENALKLFAKLPQLWMDLRDFASNYMNFLSEDAENAVKN